MQLTLFVPELIWPEPLDAATFAPLRCPQLQRFLARAGFTCGGALLSAQERAFFARDDAAAASAGTAPGGPASFEAALAALFGFAAPPPYAALRLAGEAALSTDESAAPRQGGWPGWICADPVHLRLHQERLLLADGAQIGLTLAEAQALLAELNDHFADFGTFHALAPERWYLRLHEAIALPTPPLSVLAGRRLLQQLPEDAACRRLRRMLNEAQMLLFQHPVNQARQQAGQMTANSLWLWGSGEFAAPAAPPAGGFTRVHGAHPLLRGMALASGARPAEAVASLAELWPVARGERVLVLVDDLLRAVQYEDIAAWQAGVEALEENWLAPLTAALRRGELRLALCASTIYGNLRWQGGRLAAWRCWRRPANLQALALRLAKANGSAPT